MKNKIIIKIRNGFFLFLLFGFIALVYIVMSICLLIPRSIFWWLFSDDSLIDNIKESYKRFPES